MIELRNRPQRATGMARSSVTWARVGAAVWRAKVPLIRSAGGLVVLLLVVRQLGAEPFGAGLRALTWPAAGAAFAVTAATTACSAWRWRVAAQALGLKLDLRHAIGAYYRSQFLNSVLPGGVLGDVDRGVTHGRHSDDLGRGLRAVAWERFSGQIVQAFITLIVLVTMPSPVRPAARFIAPAAIGITAVAGCVLAARHRMGHGWHRLPRVAGTLARDLRGLRSRRVWPQLAATSVLIVVGHTTVFVIAARVAGCSVASGELVALAMLIQTAMVVPLSVGGWGLREGAAAWAFAAAGLGAGTGVAVTTAFGVLALVAILPGAGLLLRDAACHLRGFAAGEGRRIQRRGRGIEAQGAPQQMWQAIGG